MAQPTPTEHTSSDSDNSSSEDEEVPDLDNPKIRAILNNPLNRNWRDTTIDLLKTKGFKYSLNFDLTMGGPESAIQEETHSS